MSPGVLDDHASHIQGLTKLGSYEVSPLRRPGKRPMAENFEVQPSNTARRHEARIGNPGINIPLYVFQNPRE